MIRRAYAADADRLTALMHESGAFQGECASILAGYRVTADYIARHQVFVETGPADVVRGFYALITESPELDLMFVADDAQGQGLGRSLIDHMLTGARRAGLSAVRVVAHPPAEGFYRRMGAEKIGTVAPRPPKFTWECPELRFVLT